MYVPRKGQLKGMYEMLVGKLKKLKGHLKTK